MFFFSEWNEINKRSLFQFPRALCYVFKCLILCDQESKTHIYKSCCLWHQNCWKLISSWSINQLMVADLIVLNEVLVKLQVLYDDGYVGIIQKIARRKPCSTCTMICTLYDALKLNQGFAFNALHALSHSLIETSQAAYQPATSNSQAMPPPHSPWDEL